MAENTPPALAEPPRAFDSFLSLEFGRQLGLMLGLAASISIGVGLALWLIIEKDYKPLFDSLESADSAAAIDVLDASDISYRIDRRSGALLVDANQIHQARMQLSSAGVSTQHNVGFELLEKEQSLGTSQFMENARYRRGLEGELARTISSIGSVKSARVHLAIPKSTVFLRDARQPRASVFIEAYQGLGIDKAQVRAIANLVVSGVPELSLQNVTVVDQRGNLLSDFDNDPRYAEAAKQLKYTRQVETGLLQRVNSLLDPIIGGEKFRAEVAVDLDFTLNEQTAEIFNPDLPAIRSEQTSSENMLDGENSGGVPGALSNQPPVDGQIGGEVESANGVAAPRRSRVNETRNFELDRTISHTRQQLGRVKRITVAVALDDLAASAATGEEQTEATSWQQADLDRLTVLVQNAVGYDASRGDRVTVVNTPFLRVVEEMPPIVELKLWEQSWFWTAIKMVLGVLAFFIIVFMVLRPTMKGLAENSRKLRELEVKHREALNAVNEVAGGAQASIAEDGSVTLTAANKNLLPSPADNLEGQIEMVKNMIDDDPDRVAQVIQGWTKTDE
jgi:flagellar M-ring protein FliF